MERQELRVVLVKEVVPVGAKEPQREQQQQDEQRRRDAQQERRRPRRRAAGEEQPPQRPPEPRGDVVRPRRDPVAPVPRAAPRLGPALPASWLAQREEEGRAGG